MADTNDEVDYSQEHNPPSDPQALREAREAMESGNEGPATLADMDDLMKETGFGEWSKDKVTVQDVAESGSPDNSEIDKSAEPSSKVR